MWSAGKIKARRLRHGVGNPDIHDFTSVPLGSYLVVRRCPLPRPCRVLYAWALSPHLCRPCSARPSCWWGPPSRQWQRSSLGWGEQSCPGSSWCTLGALAAVPRLRPVGCGGSGLWVSPGHPHHHFCPVWYYLSQPIMNGDSHKLPPAHRWRTTQWPHHPYHLPLHSSRQGSRAHKTASTKSHFRCPSRSRLGASHRQKGKCVQGPSTHCPLSNWFRTLAPGSAAGKCGPALAGCILGLCQVNRWLSLGRCRWPLACDDQNGLYDSECKIKNYAHIWEKK